MVLEILHQYHHHKEILVVMVLMAPVRIAVVAVVDPVLLEELQLNQLEV